MLKDKILLLILLFTTIGLLAQNDTLSTKEFKERKKLLKKKKKTVYNDTLVLSNKNILVGEIKNMDKSVVVFKTKYSDSDFKIKWHKVVEIQSDRMFIIALDDGSRITSSLQSLKGSKGKLILDSGVNAVEEDLINIVFIEPIGKNFLSRLTIDIDFGVTITKTNNLKQLTSNFNTTYLANKWRSNAYFKTVLSSQDGIDDLNRMDAEISFQYFLPNDWFAQVNAIYLSNDEQKLNLRSTYRGGMGYFFIHSNKMFLAATTGLAYTNENYIDDTPSKTSSELFLGAGFNKYDIGDLSLFTSAVIYPSLTDKGRYRADVNFDMKYDLPFDLYIKTSLTYNYDNQPIEGASNEDYVFTTSFGWEFN